MKLRYQLNNNANKYIGEVYETRSGDKIKVFKHTTEGNSPDGIHLYGDQYWVEEEWFEFNTIAEYKEWLKNQDWVDKKKIKRICDFMKVKEA